MIRSGLESIQLETSTGAFVLTFEGPNLVASGWPALGAKVEASSQTHVRTKQSIQALFIAYFDGLRPPPSLLELETPDGTPFQRACWSEARAIDPGSTRTYGWLAARIGQPKAARAVGQAMRANPLPIVVPCHRVVGKAPGSGGFSGLRDGSLGMQIKTKLLELEQPRAVAETTQR